MLHEQKIIPIIKVDNSKEITLSSGNLENVLFC